MSRLCTKVTSALSAIQYHWMPITSTMSVLRVLPTLRTSWLMTITPDVGMRRATISIFLEPDDDELREPVGLFSQVARRMPITARNNPRRMPQRTEQRVKMVRKFDIGRHRGDVPWLRCG